jgi:hypothetical protein
LLAVLLLAREHVPQPEFGAHAPVALARDAAGHQRLRVDRAPVGEARHGIRVDDILDEGGGVDRCEQAGAPQIAGDDLRDTASGLGILRRAAGEFRQRNRHRLEIAFGDLQPQNCRRRMREQAGRDRAGTEAERAAAIDRRQGMDEVPIHW